MGYAVAACAARRGHQVHLVSGPVSIPAPPGVDVRRVTTAGEMLAAVDAAINDTEVLIMAAAVADWRPVAASSRKLKKAGGPPDLKLERTPDILTRMRERKGHRLYVGFAAETENMLREARRKLLDKGLDLVVANDVSRPDAGFEVDTNRVVLLDASGETEALPLMSKQDVAERILDWVEQRAGIGRRPQEPGRPPSA
jgi:phosphopantothenoylcysteine decarboxylase / phosphopantothenate---cysteine ligase